MYVAMMWSGSFEWMSLGTTEAEAKGAILKAWNDAQTKLIAMGYEDNKYGSVEDLEEDYDINMEELSAGQCFMR